jgi:hypothetical protein
MTFDDELLLTTLGGALETRTASPSAEELDAFRALVVGAGGDVVPFPEAIGPRAGRRRGRTVLAAAALAASLVVVGGAGALATGTTLPNVFRAPVRALGINVDDTSVAQTRAAMAELRAALDGTDDARVQVAALALAAKLRTLSASDLSEVEAQARALLQVAESRLNPGLGGVRTEITVPSPTAPPAADPAPNGDDSAAETSGSGTAAIGSEAPDAEDPAAEAPSTPTATTEPGDDSGSGSVDD